MTKKIVTLSAENREEKENINTLRKEGWIPAVIYGAGSKATSLKVKKADFEKVYAEAGESSLVELETGGGEKVQTLIHDIQRAATKDGFIHIDFYKVDMTHKVSAPIKLEFIGESKAVKELGGMFTANHDEVEVECLPADLPEHIEVDISVLKELGDMIHASDLKMPASVELLMGPDEIIAMVAAHHEEKIEEAPVVEAPVEEVKTEEKKEEEKK